MARSYIQGIYTPINPQKYKGDVRNIVFRSSWELSFLKWCDTNPSILEYSSEETIVPYLNELDNKFHRYFVDALIKVKTSTGIHTYLIEIKPDSQVKRPVPPKKLTKKSKANYQLAIDTWLKNQFKWKAATEYAQQRGWNFKILTEHDLGLPK